MPKQKKLKKIRNGDVPLDIADFALEESQKNDSVSQAIDTHAPMRKMHHDERTTSDHRLKAAKQAIDKLILIDVSHSVGIKRPKLQQQQKPAEHRSERSEPIVARPIKASVQPSRHVIDLKKQYLIEKNRLHTINQPTHTSLLDSFAPLFRMKERVNRHRYHLPERPVVQHRQQLEKVVEKEPHAKWSIEPFIATVRTSITHAAPRRMSMLRVPVTFILIAGILIFSIPGFSTVTGVIARGSMLVTEAKDAFAHLTDVSRDSTAQVSETQRAFENLSQSVATYEGYLHDLSRIVPYVGTHLNVAKAFLTLGQEAAALDVLMKNTVMTDTDAYPITDTLGQIQRHIRTMRDTVDRYRSDLASIDESLVPSEYWGAARYVKSHVFDILQVLSQSDTALSVLRSMMGSQRVHRVLFLFQNTHELRATGGFIGSYMLIDFSRGAVIDMTFPGAGTYELTAGMKRTLRPPRPLQILNDRWFLWDANWSPDFPTAAATIARFYEESSGTTIDEVVAINSDVAQALLGLTGPIDMPEYGVTISAETFYQVVQQEVERDYDKIKNEPKQILKDLYPLLLSRLLERVPIQTILETIMVSLDAKDIQVYSKESVIQGQLSTLQWDGALREPMRDYLSVVSSNIAGGKSSAAVYDTISHTATVEEDGSVSAVVELERENRADASDPFAYINNVEYLRFYVPRGSELVEASGFTPPPESLFRPLIAESEVDPAIEALERSKRIDPRSGVEYWDEGRYTVFAQWAQVAPGSSTHLTVSYRLPFKLNLPSRQGVSWFSMNDRADESSLVPYSIVIQKQSGKKHVIVTSTLRAGATRSIVWANAVPSDRMSMDEQTITVNTPFDRDVSFAVLLADRNTSSE